MTHSNMPKQWTRWFKKAGLKSEYSSKLARNYGHAYFKGHGRYWRLDDGGYLDMSEPFEQFDRWANSLEASVPMDAQNEKEFVALVMRLLPEWERLKFRFRHRLWKPKTDFAKIIRKLKLSRDTDVVMIVDSCSAEHIGSQIDTMRILKERTPGMQPGFELIARGMGKGRSIFFSNPTRDEMLNGCSVERLMELTLGAKP